MNYTGSFLIGILSFIPYLGSLVGLLISGYKTSRINKSKNSTTSKRKKIRNYKKILFSLN